MANAPHIARNGSALELDKDWVRNSFMLSHVPNRPTQGTMSKEDKKWLYFTTASQKFVTTGLGGNFVLNPPPKYTRYADIPTGLWVDHIVNESNVAENRPTRDRKWAGGLGRYYSESIDDNAYMVHMRFGVPQYKGLVTFFTGFYDINASQLARDGTASLSNIAGRLIGTVIALPFLPIIFAFKAAKMFLATPSTKYYTSKPTMPLYWNRVNTIANSIGISKGLLPKGKLLFDLGEGGDKDMFEELGLETREMTKANYRDQYAQMRKLVPHWFKASGDSGGVDIQAIIGSAAVVQHATRERLSKLMESAKDPQEMQTKYEDYLNKFGADRSIRPSSIDNYLKAYFQSRLGNPDLQASDPFKNNMEDRLANVDAVLATGGTFDDSGADVSEGAGGSADGVIAGGTGADTAQFDDMARAYAEEDGTLYPVLTKEEVDANGNSMYSRTPPHFNNPDIMDISEGRAGSDLQWLVLKVDAIDNVSESFSNSTTQSEIQNKINGMSSSAQSARFSLADFNTGFGVIDEVIKTVKSTISGVASGLQLDGLVSLTGAGFVDIPERWDASTADFPSASYSMQLRAPYGNLMSQFINIDVPLACLLAAALPISHGNQSYGAPFLCEMYIQGKNVIRLGMISSLSITRGTGNLGWAPDGSAIGVDVSFTIKDLSTVMHAPIDTAISSVLDPFGGLLPRDSAFHDYLSVLGNMSVWSMTTNMDRLRMNVANKRNIMKNMFTPGHVMSALYDTTPGRFAVRLKQESGVVNDSLKAR